MGTRHIIEVIAEGETRIRQYGQWDGYPEVAGVDIALFLTNPELELKSFTAQCVELTRLTDEELTALRSPYVSTYTSPNGATVEAMALDKADEFTKDFPALSRDTGVQILNLVWQGLVDTVYIDAYDGDDLEYVYVIDLDKGTVSVNGTDEHHTFTFAQWGTMAVNRFEKLGYV
jgi:hypothetical protein